MVFSWFPGNLFFMEGGWEGLKIIAPIDLVLGPALTLIFYRPWKKNVKFDMSVIVLLQVVALGYGVFTAHGQRTAVIAFADNRFETVSFNEFKEAQRINMEKGRPFKSLEELGGKMPVIVYAEQFTGEEFRQHFADTLNGGLELRERSDRYRLLDTLTDELEKDLEKLRANDSPVAAGDSEIVEVPASGNPPASATDKFQVPLQARFSNGAITLDPKTYKILHISRDE